MTLSQETSKLLVPKYLELATEIIQSAMTDPAHWSIWVQKRHLIGFRSKTLEIWNGGEMKEKKKKKKRLDKEALCERLKTPK